MKKLFNNFRAPATVTVEIDPPEGLQKNRTITVFDPNDQFSEGETPQAQTFPLFDKDDPICGKIHVKPEKAFDHSGIKIELIGEISTCDIYDWQNKKHGSNHGAL